MPDFQKCEEAALTNQNSFWVFYISVKKIKQTRIILEQPGKKLPNCLKRNTYQLTVSKSFLKHAW